jgi:hypothetical protein
MALPTPGFRWISSIRGFDAHANNAEIDTIDVRRALKICAWPECQWQAGCQWFLAPRSTCNYFKDSELCRACENRRCAAPLQRWTPRGTSITKPVSTPAAS